MRLFVMRIWNLVTRVPAIVWTLLLLLLLFLLIEREEGALAATIQVMRRARLHWLIVLSLLAISIQAMIAIKARVLLRILDRDVPYLPLVDALLRRNVISTLMPFGAAPGTVYFGRRMRAYDVSSQMVVLMYLLFSTLGHASFAVVMIPTLIWLAATSSISTSILIGAVLLGVIAGCLILLIPAVIHFRRLPAFIDRRLSAGMREHIAELIALDVNLRQLLLPFCLALFIDGLGIGMVWSAMQAIHVHGTLGMAAAGYVVGSIFLLVSPILQGIGLVEVSMTVILQRLGLSSSEALGTTLLFRVGDTWGPLAIGIALQIRAREALQRVPRNFPAIFTGMTGLISVCSVLAPAVPHHLNRLEDYGFVSFVDGSRTSSLIAGTLLIVLSVALWRRRLAAWWCAVVLLGILMLTHVFKRHDQVLAVISALNLAMLLITRNRFRVRSDIPTIRRGIVLLVGSLTFAVAYGTLGFWLLDKREFGIGFSLRRSVEETLRLFFNLGETDLTPHTRYARWFLDSVSVVGVLAVIVAAISLLRPVVWRARTHPAEREEARRLIALHGRSALDAFKIDDDKLFFFSADRQSVISFGLASGAAIALGDPTAPDETALRQVLTEFLDFCDANAWHAAFHQVHPDHLEAYRDAGMSVLKLGEEAIVDLTTWSLAGNSMKGFRSGVNRIERDGFVAVVHEAPLSDDLVAKLRSVSDAWLTLPGRRERAFTLGHWDDAVVRQCPILALEKSDGEIVAFINVVADGVPGEGTFDMMRHTPDAPNGSMDVLFVNLAQYFRDRGLTAYSLGMVPFYDVGANPTDPLLERAIRLLTERMERFFSYRGLSAYKDKFHPTWQPRYLVYPSNVVLPQVAIAIVRLTEGPD